MKNLPILLSLLFTLFISVNVFAGNETLKIQTDAVCGHCKQTIEGNVIKLKGVKSADLDLKTKILTVTYNTEKVSADEIKKAVVDSGYKADEMPGDDKSRSAQPHCCQKGDHKH